MRLGASKKFVSSDCYCLLGLVSEAQNDVEIVKPVLDELEVMRLGCSLGMLSSVSTNDFEVEMLEAEEFDDDLAHFLRKEVFEASENEGVKLISLFGKQEAVKSELTRCGCWSDEIEANLKKEDQGIYCITRKHGVLTSVTRV